MILLPLPSRVRENLTATRRCGSTRTANPSDGRGGYCAAPASRQLPGKQRGKTTEERREGGSTPQKDKPDASRGSWSMTPAVWQNNLGKAGLRGALACWHSGLRAVTQVRVCSSQTRNLSLSFSELLVAICGVQSLERPGEPNSSRHATSPVTTEACIIAHAGCPTLSPAPANCVLLLLSLVLLPVRSCPSARAEDLTCLRLYSWRQGGVFSRRTFAESRHSKARSSTGK